MNDKKLSYNAYTRIKMEWKFFYGKKTRCKVGKQDSYYLQSVASELLAKRFPQYLHPSIPFYYWMTDAWQETQALTPQPPLSLLLRERMDSLSFGYSFGTFQDERYFYLPNLIKKKKNIIFLANIWSRQAKEKLIIWKRKDFFSTILIFKFKFIIEDIWHW